MTDWNVELYFDGVNVEASIADQIDDLFEPLLALGPVATFGPESLSVGVTTEAKSPELAWRSAKTVISDAMVKARFGRGRLVGIEMYATEELDRRNQLPNYPEVVGVAEVARILNVSKQRVSELARSRNFPRPLYELAAGPIWIKGAIDNFVEDWDRKPGRPRRVASG